MQKINTKTIGIIAGVFVLLAAVLFIGGSLTNQDVEAQSTDDGVVTAFIGDLSASATASGKVESGRTAALVANTPGTVTDVYVGLGDHVAAGEALVQLDTADLALSVTLAEQTVALKEANLADLLEETSATEIKAAETAVASARATLEDLLNGPTAAEIALSEANLNAANASLWSASASLGSVRDSVTEAQIKAAEAQLLAAQLQQEQAWEDNQENTNAETHQTLQEANQALASAQGTLNSLLAGPDSGQLGSAQGSVVAAAARVDGNEADFNSLLAGSSVSQIANAESQVASAEATLASLLDGPSADEIRSAEAEVIKAQLDLVDAQESLAKATLTAPFAGVVTAVHVNSGEQANGPLIELSNNENLQVVLEVDEVDIGNLAVGQPAIITLETWPTVEIVSEIEAIAPGANTISNSALVTYDVHLSLGATDLPVRLGMSADANLVTAEKAGVLLVPNAAINTDRNSGTYSVTLIVGQTEQAQPVTVGLRDNEFTQITSGVNVGDSMLIND